MRRSWLVLLLAAGAAGCAAAEDPERSRAPAPGRTEPAPAAREASCAPGSLAPMRSARQAYAAVVRRPLTAYRRPGGGPLSRFGLENVNGVANVLGVLAAVRGEDCEPHWYRVQLPRKPNGAVGYVRAADVRLLAVRTRIHVDLSERRVTLYRAGRVVLRATAAVGSSATPTPTGSFYVNQRLIPYDTDGPFGPGAVGISAFSEVLTGWAQGGPIAIHGTNEPWSIGRPVSNGCLRIRNDLLRTLFRHALPGTPVVIRA